MIREVTPDDIETTLEAGQASGLFGPDELPVLRRQLEETLAGRGERGGFWLADFDPSGTALGAAYCVEELMTDRVWNLLFIGVRREHQGGGIGAALLEAVEARLRETGQRMLVIETTNGEEFAATRAFYVKHGYAEEGTVRDFYATGMDKIVFRKLLE